MNFHKDYAFDHSVLLIWQAGSVAVPSRSFV